MSAHNALEQQFLSEFLVPDPGNGGTLGMDRDRQQYAIATGGAETRTLPDPHRPGLLLSISMIEDGGDCVIASDSPINATGNNRITLDDVNDTILLISIRTAAGHLWRVMGNDGCALSTV